MNIWIGFLLALVMLVGCAGTQDERTYSRDQARRIQTVELGTIEAINQVVIEGRRSPLSNVAGAVIGGIAGHSVGGGHGQAVGTAVGVIAGGVAGGAIDERLTRANGLDLTILTDNGKMISVVQEISEQSHFQVGDRVRILRLDGDVRVAHWGSSSP